MCRKWNECLSSQVHFFCQQTDTFWLTVHLNLASKPSYIHSRVSVTPTVSCDLEANLTQEGHCSLIVSPQERKTPGRNCPDCFQITAMIQVSYMWYKVSFDLLYIYLNKSSNVQYFYVHLSCTCMYHEGPNSKLPIKHM